MSTLRARHAMPAAGGALAPAAALQPGVIVVTLDAELERALRAASPETPMMVATTPAALSEAIQAAMAVALIVAVVFAVTGPRMTVGERAALLAKSNTLNIGDYHSLRIPELPSNTRPYVATEGYVRNVYVDPEEKTLHFTLVEAAQGSEPFVVCEILSPAGMAVPQEGNRVRVYGVARYDSQPGRKWYEVNPVLDFAVLKR